METRLKVYFSGNMWITPADSQVRSLPSLAMDFDTLFQDLENQLERELDAEIINRLDDEERERRAKLTLRERLRALHQANPASVLTALTKDGRALTLQIKNVGKDWAAIEVLEPSDIRGPLILALHALSSVGIPQESVKESLGTPVGEVSDHDLRELSRSSRLAEKVNFAFVLRDVSRRRKRVMLYTALGKFQGTLDQVGADHLDVSSDGSRHLLPLRDLFFVRIE